MYSAQMTKAIGRINQDILAAYRCNEGPESRLEDWVAEWSNAKHAEVGSDGTVWLAEPMAGHWLSQEQIDDFVLWVEARDK